MGYAMMIGFCINCKLQISFHPHKVPSLRVNGVRQPLCRGCAIKWNQMHPNEARPILEGAYEPFPEEEL